MTSARIYAKTEEAANLIAGGRNVHLDTTRPCAYDLLPWIVEDDDLDISVELDELDYYIRLGRVIAAGAVIITAAVLAWLIVR